MTMPDKNPCQTCSNRPGTPFSCVGSGTMDYLALKIRSRIVKKGEMLFVEGDQADGFYCIKKGSVRNFRTSYGGKEQTFHISNGGDWVGFRDTVSGEDYNHSSVCLEESEVCFIHKSLISQLMLKDEKFQMEIMKYMASEWNKSEKLTFSLGTKQVHNKLAELLLVFREASENRAEIDLYFSREVMASIIGVTTETLVRALSDFKSRNWIRQEGKKIIFLNLPELNKLAEIEFR